MGSRSAKKSKKMQKSDSDLDEYDDDMSFNEVNDDSEVEEEEEEDDEGSDEEEEDERQKESGWKDDEMEQLEKEYMDLHHQEQELNTLKNLKHHKDEDLLKGQAVKAQKALWYKILELRFLLQKPFSSSNRLPQESIKESFCESDETVRGAYEDLITSSKETLDSILELQEALIAKNPSIAQASNGSERSSKDLEISNDLDDNLDQEWAQISQMHNSMATFRDKSINKWQRMTQVTTGAAAIKGKLHAFNQDISHQVAAYMRDPSRMIKQMQLRRSEQTFIRVQERFSQMLTPKVRVTLEYLYLFVAITFFCILVVMHANYVQQPGCSSELSGVLTSDAQLIQIKITSAGLWYHNDSEPNIIIDPPDTKPVKDKMELSHVNQDESSTFLGSKFLWNLIGSGPRRGNLAFKFWKADTEFRQHQAETSTTNQNSRPVVEDTVIQIDQEEQPSSFTSSVKETLKAGITHFGKKWYRRISFIWRHTLQIIASFQKLWDFAGVHLNLDIPKWMHILHLDKVNSNAVQWLKKKTKLSEPTYLYTMEKGYFLLPESAKSRHNIRTVNVSISAWHSCFGNRWQQLLINRFVGYDTILINSLLSSPGQGYLYNYQSKEFYNLSFAQEVPEVPAKFGDYLVMKCGVLMMSLFVFFTTTMSVSFTLRETQTRMLKFTVQLQHHARHHLPTFQLIFVHVIESLVFVPIMIGILFFLFEFYDDQLLAFMVLILVWLCELFTLISVRTPISMKFFPRFFLLYFLVFHIYFFSYAYGFSYLALSATAAFMQHLILYFWNRFEIPALQRFVQNRRSQLQQHPDFHITSSTILASTLHITRLNTRNPGLSATNLPSGTGFRPGFDQPMPQNGPGVTAPQGRSESNPDGVANPTQIPGQADTRQAERGPNPGSMNPISSMLLWILGGASSEGLNSFFSMFRDARDQGQVYTEAPRHDNPQNQESDRQR